MSAAGGGGEGGPYQRRARVCGAPCQSAPGGPYHGAGRGGSGLRAGSPVAARGLSGVSSGRAAAGRAQPIPVTGPAAPRRRRPFLPPSRPPARGVGGAGPARKNGAALNARGEEPGGLRVRRRPRADRDPPRGGPGPGGLRGGGLLGAPLAGRAEGGGRGPRGARPLCAVGPRPAGGVRCSRGRGRPGVVRGAVLPGVGLGRPVRPLLAVLLRSVAPGGVWGCGPG